MARNRQRTSGVLALLFFALAAAMLVAMCGCSRWSPTQAGSQDEEIARFNVTSLIITQCKVLGVTPRVQYTNDVVCGNVPEGYEDTLSFTDTYCPSPTQVPNFMWAVSSNNTIWVWDIPVDGEWYSQTTLTSYARHECAHLYYGHHKGAAWEETEADACVRNWPEC